MATAAVAVLALLALPPTPARAGFSYDTSWFGNTFPGTPNPNIPGDPNHVQDTVLGMYVSSNGTCYTNSIWDEGGQEAGIYAQGQVTGSCSTLHGWGRGGGSAIVADSNYLYVAITQNGDDGADPNRNGNKLADYPAANNIWYAVRRYDHAGNPVPFSSGYGYDGSMLVVNAGKRSGSGSPYSGQAVSGLADDGSYLYVSDPASAQVKKYSLSNLSETPVQTWSLGYPGPMTYANGSLYVVQAVAHKILKYSTTGTLQATIRLANNVVPSALAYDNYNGTNLLLVADQGPDQNVKEFNLGNLTGSPTAVAATFGVTGGIYAGTGAQIGTVGPLRFNDPTGVGVDSSGNIYVSQDGTNNPSYGAGTEIESYTPAGNRSWQVGCQAFVDCPEVDPSSETDVFSKDKHWTMNYGNQFPYTPAPGSEATYAGYTINRFKYPQDLRLHIPGPNNQGHAWVREFQGHKFMISTDQQCAYLSIYRFNSVTDGECAIPSVVFAQSYNSPDSTGWPNNEPSQGEWIWRDANGNGAMDASEYTQISGQPNIPSRVFGYWVDSNGDVWEATQGAGIRHFALQGLDSQGNPIYNYAHMATIAMPSQFYDLERIEYYPDTDTMYLSGYSDALPNPNIGGYWGSVGTTICRYDNWTTNPTLHVGYPVTPPWVVNSQYTASMSVTGQFLFVGCSPGIQINVYNADTGALAGTIYTGTAIGGTGTAGPDVIGWTDIRYGIRAYERSNGEYIIFQEDDLLGKIVMYRWTPTFRLVNRSLSPDCLNIDSGALGCSADGNYGSWNTQWVEEPGQSGTFRLRTLNSGGQYINVQNGTLQYGTASPSSTTSMWGLQDVDGTYNYLYNLSNTQDYINTQNGLACSPINGGWWSSMWLFDEIN